MLAPVAHVGAHPTCIRAVAGGIAGFSLDPACCGRHIPGAGPISSPASFSPGWCRSRATRPSAGRVRPVWEVGGLCSGDATACRHETCGGIAPQGDQQLAGQSHDMTRGSAPGGQW